MRLLGKLSLYGLFFLFSAMTFQWEVKQAEAAAPSLSFVEISTSEVPAAVALNITGRFGFTDVDADLGGGTFNYTYDGETYGVILPGELTGISGGTVEFSLVVVFNATLGMKNIPCWLKDSAGNESNIFYVNILQVWTRQSATEFEDFGEAVAVDVDYNIYVAGRSAGNGLLSKYLLTSANDWNRSFGTGYLRDVATGIAKIGDFTDDGSVDLQDAIIALKGLGQMPFTISVNIVNDLDGDSRIGLSEVIYVLQVYAGIRTGGSSVYVTGYQMNGANGLDILLARYDYSGNQRWLKVIGTTQWDEALGLAVDNRDNIYVTGKTWGDLDGEDNAGMEDVFLAKYDASGEHRWTRLLGSFQSETGRAVVVDNVGGVYVTGGTNYILGEQRAGGSVLNDDVFVAKFDDSGNKLFITQFGTTCTEWGSGIAVDSSGNIFVSGSIITCAFDGNTAAGSYDIFLAKLDASGNLQWVKQSGTDNSDKAMSVAVDSHDNIYVTGYWDSAYSTPTSDNEGKFIFLAKYNSAGESLWMVQENGGNNWGNQGKDIAIDSQDNIFITGTTHGSLVGSINPNPGEDDLFVMKFDNSGVSY